MSDTPDTSNTSDVKEDTKKKLTRSDIIDLVNKMHPNFIKANIKVVVNSTLDALAEVIASGEQVEVRRLGVFSIRERPARKSRNPRTGESIQVDKSCGVRYKMSREVKEKLNKFVRGS